MVVLFALPFGDAAISPCESGAPAPLCRGEYTAFGSAADSVRAVPIFVFSFTCHQNIVSISNELDRPTPRRVLALVTAAISMSLATYLTLAHAGYYTFGNRVNDDILSSYPSSRPIVAIARCLIAIVVTCCYPLQAHPSRGCITSIILVAQRGLGQRPLASDPTQMSTEPLIAASHSGTPRSSLLASRGSDPHYLVGPCTADETAASRDLHSTPSATDNRLDGNAVTRSGGEAVGGRPRGTDNSPSSDDLETDFVVDGDAPVGGNAVAPSQGSSLRLHLLVSTVFVFASGAIALLVTDLGIVLSVVGATGSTIVSYILPGITYYRLSRKPKRRLGLALFCAGMIIMPLALTLIAIDAAASS